MKQKISNFTKNEDAILDDSVTICCGLLLVILVIAIVYAFFSWLFSIHIILGIGVILLTIFIVDNLFDIGIFNFLIDSTMNTINFINWKRENEEQSKILQHKIEDLTREGVDTSILRDDLNTAIKDYNKNLLKEINDKVNDAKENLILIQSQWQEFNYFINKPDIKEIKSYLSTDIDIINNIFKNTKRSCDTNQTNFFISKINSLKNKTEVIMNLQSEWNEFNKFMNSQKREQLKKYVQDEIKTLKIKFDESLNHPSQESIQSFKTSVEEIKKKMKDLDKYHDEGFNF